MRFSRVVFPAPRKPVRIVSGTVLPPSFTISISVCSQKAPVQRIETFRDRRGSTAPLFLELTQIESHHSGHFDEIDLLRSRELGERLPINVRRIVLLRINLEVARQL